MTVCTASLFFWNYGDDKETKHEPAVMLASDRMLTDPTLGIEYETSRFKGSVQTKTHFIMVSGAIVVHSDILRRLTTHLNQNPHLNTHDIAEVCSEYINEYRSTEAEKIFLSPLSLTQDAYLERQRTLDPAFVSDIRKQLQEHQIDAEMIVAGCDGDTTNLYHVSTQGLVTNHADIGFLSIGLGGIHSSAHFMLEPYRHTITFYPAMYLTYCAKKRAEIAPGVGPYTDMFFINRSGVTNVHPDIVKGLDRIYVRAKAAASRKTKDVGKEIMALERAVYGKLHPPSQQSG